MSLSPVPSGSLQEVCAGVLPDGEEWTLPLVGFRIRANAAVSQRIIASVLLACVQPEVQMTRYTFSVASGSRTIDLASDRRFRHWSELEWGPIGTEGEDWTGMRIRLRNRTGYWRRGLSIPS
jgi:hypothetical protein